MRSRKSAVILLGLFAGLACLSATSLSGPIDPRTDRVCGTELVVSPVVSSRSWGTLLAPNAKGSYNLVTSFWELGTKNPTEYLIVDIKTGECKRIEDKPDHFLANFGYKGQTRAANGRIFFPQGSRGENNLAYYDPDDETIKSLGSLLDGKQGDRMFYQRVFGPDGMLYCATHSYQNPTVVRVNPDTLEVKVLGKIGRKDRPIYCYAYHMALDLPWIYVAIGKKPFELAALNAETGESKVLVTRDDPDNWLRVGYGWAGVRALYTIHRGQKEKKKHWFYWCADGAVYPCTSPWKDDGKPLPFTRRKVKETKYPLKDLPELNLTEICPDATGTSRIYWRPKGSKDPWHATTFKVKHLAPIMLESLLALPDGTLFGNARQYHGFFRYNPKTGVNRAFGRFHTSRGPRLLYNGLVYISGYPGSGLFVYDPSKPWVSDRLPKGITLARDAAAAPPAERNPKLLGNFYAYTAAQYSVFLAGSRNKRIYLVGRRERTGVGGGIAYYDTATGTFGGHHENLNFLAPRGLVVADQLQRVIYSGALRKDPSSKAPPPKEAQLVVYDMDLKEVERLTVKPGITHSGRIHPVKGNPSLIVGVVPPEKAVYRYDLARKKLLDWVELNGAVTNVEYRETDGTVWLVLANPDTKVKYLGFLDPATMKWTTLGQVPAAIPHLAWVGDDIYATMTAESGGEQRAGLWRIRPPDEGK